MIGFLTQYGYGFILLVVLLESVALPVPGESLVIAAGMLASRGDLDIVLVLGAAFVGSILGDNIGYAVGRRYGRRAIVRWGGKVGFGQDKLKLVETKFRSYGFVIVLIARFVFILRQLNGFVAGMMRMPWPQFLLYNSISAALWTAAYGLTAFYFGKALELFLEEQSTWLILLISGSVCAIGMFGTYKVLFDEKPGAATETGTATETEDEPGKIARP
ncbi:DedA family protein [Fulvimarina sp. 2208YS6-2-32]|uniref:DedA family protein n=1 Tax=Fulvimarina uroteuthidis TaxID=3098149 RepID=A0ABU5HZJ6_9HYPH|nr:DedA family protein [Fulvimarina sp. 2208YS6-2-32]MDY8108557.1 DedA family protein [Fulvimarina sp. 2208YS6-2-32]